MHTLHLRRTIIKEHSLTHRSSQNNIVMRCLSLNYLLGKRKCNSAILKNSELSKDLFYKLQFHSLADFNTCCQRGAQVEAHRINSHLIYPSSLIRTHSHTCIHPSIQTFSTTDPPTPTHTHTNTYQQPTHTPVLRKKSILTYKQANEQIRLSIFILFSLSIFLTHSLTHTLSNWHTLTCPHTHTHAHTHLNALTRTTQENTNTWRDDWILHGWFATKKKEEEGSDACFNKNGNYDSISNQLISRSGLLRKYGLSKPAPPGAVYRNERREGSGL